MDDKARGREIAKKFSRARKRITELNDEIAQLKLQRAERTREANAALAERDRAREVATRAEQMFLACYKAFEDSKAIAKPLFEECCVALRETRCECTEGSGICQYCTPKADLLRRINLLLKGEL